MKKYKPQFHKPTMRNIKILLIILCIGFLGTKSEAGFSDESPNPTGGFGSDEGFVFEPSNFGSEEFSTLAPPDGPPESVPIDDYSEFLILGGLLIGLVYLKFNRKVIPA